MAQRPIKIPGRRKVLTKRIIENAQEETRSAFEAARWLDVSYNTYKKWAQYYGVFEQHLNQSGKGLKKGWAAYKVPLEDILTGKRLPPKRHTHSVLKNRMIEEGYFQEECSHCGYNEANLSTGKVCLNIDFKDGEGTNFKLDNLRLLCPNCYLSFNGMFHNSKYFCK